MCSIRGKSEASGEAITYQVKRSGIGGPAGSLTGPLIAMRDPILPDSFPCQLSFMPTPLSSMQGDSH